MPYPSLNKKKDAHFEWASFFVYLNTFMRSALPSPTLILAVLPGRTSWLIPYWYPDCISALCKGYFTFSMLIFRKRFTGNIKLCSVYLYHFLFLQNCNKKGATDSVTPKNLLFLPISSYQASLRWHYPNQVLGRRSHLPLSLYTSSRLFSCEYIIHPFAEKNKYILWIFSDLLQSRVGKWNYVSYYSSTKTLNTDCSSIPMG